jgi:phage repressor protein C with HTH and peptisase S24 domain
MFTGETAMTMWAGKVEGDNMKPVLKSGDIVFYTDEQNPKSGEVCRIIKKENGKLTYMIRRVYFLKNNKVMLHSDNYFEHLPQILTLDEIHSMLPIVKPLHQYSPSHSYPVIC